MTNKKFGLATCSNRLMDLRRELMMLMITSSLLLIELTHGDDID